MRRTFRSFVFVCAIVAPALVGCASEEEAAAWGSLAPGEAPSSEDALAYEPGPLLAHGRLRFEMEPSRFRMRTGALSAPGAIEDLVMVCDTARCPREYDDCILSGGTLNECREELVLCLDCHEEE